MKNIEKLVKRITSAKNVTQNLVDKSQEFAQFIECQMIKVGACSLMNDKYKLMTIKSNICSDTSLYLRIDGDYYTTQSDVCLDSSVISSTRDTRYLYQDYNAAYNLPNRDDILEFISDAKELLCELANMNDEVETLLIDRVLLESDKGE